MFPKSIARFLKVLSQMSGFLERKVDRCEDIFIHVITDKSLSLKISVKHRICEVIGLLSSLETQSSCACH